MTQALTTTEGFSSTSNELVKTETAAAAVAAQAKAAVESRYIMAMQRPRNWDDVRVNLLKECKRPGFAQSAMYKKPIGKGIEGFSIRFVESAIRCMTNVLPEVSTVYDDAEKKIVRVTVTDLESNVSYSKDTTITKTVERSKPMSDGFYISVRKNSYGKQTYTLPATDDEILNKENALVSKALRTQGLRLIPGDILDECEQLIKETAKNKAAQDPDAERKKLVDAFAGIGVTAQGLEHYLEQELSTISPAQLVDLRNLYQAIHSGEITWKDVNDEKAKTTEPEKPEPTAKGDTQTETIKNKLKG